MATAELILDITTMILLTVYICVYACEMKKARKMKDELEMTQEVVNELMLHQEMEDK